MHCFSVFYRRSDKQNPESLARHHGARWQSIMQNIWGKDRTRHRQVPLSLSLALRLFEKLIHGEVFQSPGDAELETSDRTRLFPANLLRIQEWTGLRLRSRFCSGNWDCEGEENYHVSWMSCFPCLRVLMKSYCTGHQSVVENSNRWVHDSTKPPALSPVSSPYFWFQFGSVGRGFLIR